MSETALRGQFWYIITPLTRVIWTFFLPHFSLVIEIDPRSPNQNKSKNKSKSKPSQNFRQLSPFLLLLIKNAVYSLAARRTHQDGFNPWAIETRNPTLLLFHVSSFWKKFLLFLFYFFLLFSCVFLVTELCGEALVVIQAELLSLFICFLGDHDLGGIFLQSFFPAMTKIVGTLGPRSRSVGVISGCITAGMCGIKHFSFFLCLIAEKMNTTTTIIAIIIICS